MRPEPERAVRDPIGDAAMDWYIALSEAASITGSDEVAARFQGDVVARQFQTWLERDSRHARAWDDLTALMNNPALLAASRAEASRLPPYADLHLFTLPRRIWSRRILPGMALAAAAACLWITVPGLWLRWQADALTLAAEMLVVTLPDGSRADLNSSTALVYDFAGGRRHVTLLQGEAWFDVVHDPAHPFVVEAGDTEVTVKGTAFAVRAMAAENLVMLERGSVQVTQGGYDVVLAPGEMVGTSGAKALKPELTELDRNLAWREGWVLLREERFSTALSELSRYYSGQVLDLSSSDERLVSGSFRTDAAEAAIRSIAAASGVSVSRMPGGILILR